MSDAQGISMHPPSRHDNPFATCWTRPGAIPFHFSECGTVELLIAKLIAQNGWGAILGSHGSGKSTLVESLKPALVVAGFQIESLSLRDVQKTLPRLFAKCLSECDSNSIVIIDGYEQLHWHQRWRLRYQVRLRRAGLLVTSHQPTDIPELITLAPDRDLIEELVGAVSAKVSTAVTRDDIAASHACHGANVREVFFDLYDRHEQRRRDLQSLSTSSQRLPDWQT